MTIIEAINKVDQYKPNSYSQEDKVYWLSIIDGTVKKEIIDLHDGGFDGDVKYNSDTPLDTELLIPHPYEEIYIYWLESKIDYYNNEYKEYQNDMSRFTDMMVDYTASYKRDHMPLSHPASGNGGLIYF